MGIYLTQVPLPVVSWAAEEYPRDLLEFEALFSSEASCREHLFRLRWPEGFCCPKCGESKAWPAAERLWECVGCGQQVSVTTDDLSGQPSVVVAMVPGRMVGDEPEERS